MTEVHRDTNMRFGVRMGQAYAKIHDEKMQGLECKRVECDEVWGYIDKKVRNVRIAKAGWMCGNL